MELPNIETFAVAFGRARLDKKRYDGALETLEEEQDALLEQLGRENVVERLEKKYADEWNAIQSLYTQYNEATNSRFQEAVYDVWTAVFSNIRSRSHEVGKMKTAAWKLTVGTYGFGRRDNVQATQASRHDMWRILSEHEWIAEKLRTMNMKKWATYLEEFKKCLPNDIDMLNMTGWGSNSIRVKSPRRILVKFDEVNIYNGTESPEYADTLLIDGRNIILQQEGVDDEGKTVYTTLRRMTPFRDADAIEVVQLAPVFSQVRLQVEIIATPVIKESKEAINKLKQQFGRQVLLSSV